MKLTGSNAAVVLSSEGRDVMYMMAVAMPESPDVAVHIEDADEVGLWVRMEREDGKHIVLVRWEYVLSIDLRSSQVPSMGLRRQEF